MSRRTIFQTTPQLAITAQGGSGFWGPGYFLDVGMVSKLVNANSTLCLNSNEVWVFRFVLAFPMSIKRISWGCGNNSAGQTINFAFYTNAGALIVDCGAFANLTAPAVQTLDLTSKNIFLSAGEYFFGQAVSNQPSGTGWNLPITNTVQYINALNVTATVPRVAKATAVLAGGMPVALGPLTPMTFAQANGFFGPGMPYFSPGP